MGKPSFTFLLYYYIMEIDEGFNKKVEKGLKICDEIVYNY